MREIKFRAWDKKCIEVYGTGMSYGEHEYLDDMLAFRFNHFESDNPSEIIYEQFTGLRDKNGKEIYEGDILLGVLATAGRGAVTRKEKPFHFSVVWRAPSFHLSAVDRYSNSTYRWYPAFTECEVVGNIHENPELLK